jgi:hypothetical protein
VIGGFGSLLSNDWLDNQSVNLDVADEGGRTALMYALLLDDEVCVRALVDRKANINMVDRSGCPTILFSLCTLPKSDVAQLSPQFRPVPQTIDSAVSVTGNTTFLSLLIESGVDINVCDDNGWSTLLFLLGKGNIDLSIGGYSFRFSSAAYSQPACALDLLPKVQYLISNHCNVNHCSKTGCVALHIASAEGDIAVVQALLRAHADPNALDNYGWHSLHHLLRRCPESSPELINILLAASRFKPATRVMFSDYRTGVSVESKTNIELSNHFEAVIIEAFQPLCLSAPRLVTADILCLQADRALSPILLCAAGTRIPSPLFEESRSRRITVLLQILQISQEEGILDKVLQDSSNRNFSLLHALSLLLFGESEKLILSAKQKSSRRIRYYDSDESELLEKLKFASLVDLHWCDFDIPTLKPFDLRWTPFHAVIAGSNRTLLDYFLSLFGINAFQNLHPVGIMAQFSNVLVSFAMSNKVIEISLSREDWKQQLNEMHGEELEQPIHLALKARQYDVIRALSACPKVDLNVRSAVDDLTPIQAACQLNDIGLLDALRLGKDRIDLTLPWPGKVSYSSCIEYVINERRIEILEMLIDLRRNDVIELLISTTDNQDSLLKVIERQDTSLKAGFHGEHKSTREIESHDRLLSCVLNLVNSTNCIGVEHHIDDSYYQLKI